MDVKIVINGHTDLKLKLNLKTPSIPREGESIVFNSFSKNESFKGEVYALVLRVVGVEHEYNEDWNGWTEVGCTKIICTLIEKTILKEAKP